MRGTWREPPTAPTGISPGFRNICRVRYKRLVVWYATKRGLTNKCLYIHPDEYKTEPLVISVREIVLPAAELESVLSCVYTDIPAELTLSDKVGHIFRN